MKKLVIFLLIAAPFVLDAQMTYVPDDRFEQALIDLGYDTPPLNDSVPTRNIDTVTYLRVAFYHIYDLTGIEDFIDLSYFDCSRNNLTSLDVSKNTALTLLGCNDNHLTNLVVSMNTALDTLNCYKNKLTSLDVSKNTALTRLSCSNNYLKSLDVSKNTVLRELFCSINTIKSLDVSKNTALTNLSCSYNPLTSMDVSKNTALILLGCSYNILTSLDVSNNTVLNFLNCRGNDLTSLDVSKNTALTLLDCDSNALTSLDISKNIALTWLYCHDNSLTSLDVSKNTVLTDLHCYDNPYLYCIQVADETKAANMSHWFIDYWAYYSTDCGYTGVDDFKFENKDVSVVPNPASDFIEIELGNNHTLKGVVESVKIYNFLGEIVYGLDTPPYPLFLEGGKCRIDVSGLMPGVYFVRLGVVVRKFIKI